MSEQEFQGEIAHGWEMWIGRVDEGEPTGFAFTEVIGFTDLPFPDQVPEDVDVTHMGSPNRTREEIPGLLPTADYSQEKQYWPEHLGDLLLEELADKTATGDRETVLVEFNMDPAGGKLRRTYRCYVKSFNPSGTVGDKAMVALSIKILDRQLQNARVIS